MADRGWGWTRTEIRRAQLVGWIAEQPGDMVFSPEEFYDRLPDDENTWDIAHADLKTLESRGLVKLSVAMGGIPGIHIYQVGGARQAAEELRDRRADLSARRRACRDAMVAWLASRDAVSTPNRQITEAIVSESRYGFWFGESFTPQDVDEAAAYLKRSGLADGLEVEEFEGPVQTWLTDDGAECAEYYESDVARYLKSKQQPGATVISFGGSNYGQVASGHDFSQTQTINSGPSAEHLREMINSLAQLVIMAVPGEAEQAIEQRNMALEAARDGAISKPAIQRFRDWVLGIIGKGTAQALVPLVESGTTDLMHEVAKLTGHVA